MFLRRKPKPNDDEVPIPHGWSRQATEREELGRSKSETAPFAEFSKLTAKMVELSLQEAQRQRRRSVPEKLSAVPSSSPWPSTDVHGTPEKPAESAGSPGTAAAATPVTRPREHGTPGGLRIANFTVLYSRATIILREMTNYWNEVRVTLGSWLARLRLIGSTVIGNLRDCWKSVQNDPALATFRARIAHLTIAVQRTALTRQRAALLIGSWSRRATTTAQFLAERLSTRLRILANSQPLRRLRYGYRKNLRFLFAKPYRCRDCGKGVGFRSRPRTLLERYILPLTLMQPVCCAECSRRDYRLIFTPVSERSPHRDESRNPIHRDAA
jgi:hypothetical protein